MNNLDPRFLFTVRYRYRDPLDIQRAQTLLVSNWVLFLLQLAGLVLSVLLIPPELILSTAVYEFALPLIILATIFTLGAFWMIQSGRLTTAIWLILFEMLLAMSNIALSGLFGSAFILLIIPIIVAGTLFERPVYLFYLWVLLLGILLFAAYSQSQLTQPVIPANRVNIDFITILLTISVAMVLLSFLNSTTIRTVRVNRREIDSLQKVNRFLQQLTVTDEEDAYAETILFIRDELDYVFAQVFYIATDGTLSRRVRAGLGVRAASDRSQDVRLIQGSLIDEAAQTGQLVIATVEDSGELRRSHFWTSSYLGIALPLIAQGRLLGVLDIQTEREMITPEDLRVLQALSEGLSSTIANLRLNAALRQNIREQVEITNTLRLRLQELSSELVGGSSWEGYLRQRGEALFGFNLANDGKFIAAGDLPASLRPVLETGALQINHEGDLKIVNVPINLRGEILGAMSFTLPKDRVLSERQLETAQIVADRLALALENKRLFEQTQAQAKRERKANEATNLLISATNVEAVMNVAAASFNEALGAISTRIHLQPSVVADAERSDMLI
ncbi:MAG: GAF domain-containing protein [Anaerolineae bacterium]|jgi:GAF domain-containing protein|nr:GAF domain-containing protein [Anaerolineae bacterium]